MTEVIMKESNNCVILISKDLQPTSKIAGFDLDDTLIFHSFTRETIELSHMYVPKKLEELHDDKFTICVMTNQLKCKDIEKFKDLFKLINVPMIMIVSLADDDYRKPNIGMWKLLEREIHTDIDKSKSFYVGDAAGRQFDHSDCDLKFARNVGINFFTQEFLIPKPQEIKRSKEVVFMVGYPGSGKSTYVKNNFSDYIIISSDDHKSNEASIKRALKEALNTGKSIVLDATHSCIKKRNVFLELIGNKYSKRCVQILTNLSESKFRNESREKPVPTIALTMFAKYFQTPTLAEGFDEITCVV